MKTKLTLFIITLIAATATIAISASSTPSQYHGSKRSDKYHKPSCEWAKKIWKGNLITFTSIKDAERQGYKPCKVCKP